MKKIRTIILTAVLVFSLNAGAYAGNMGTPGYVPPEDPATSESTGDMETPEGTSNEVDVNWHLTESDFALYLFWTALLLF